MIIEYDGRPVGTILVRKDDGYYIGRFFIHPECQRQGIGTHLLKKVLAEADERGQVVTLKFLKNNPVKSLYERLEFRFVRQEGNVVCMERNVIDE